MLTRTRTRAAMALVAGLSTLVAGGTGLVAASADTTTVTAASATYVTGIDIASYQHPNGKAITWSSVAGSQGSGKPSISFVMVKATQGTTYTNPYYASDVSGAHKAGLVVGAYDYASPALPLSTATADAKHFVKVTGTMRTTATLPPVLDLEWTGAGNLSAANTTAWAKKWLSTVRSLTGRTPMIYSYDNFLRSTLKNTTALSGYPLWYASYTSATPSTLPGSWNAWTIWQYSDAGKIKGITSPPSVDMDRFNGSKASLLALANGTKAGPVAPGAPTGVTASIAAPNATLSWAPPSNNGGSPVTNYIVTVDGKTAGYTPTTKYVAGPLTEGTHTVTVRAVNVVGTGPAASLTFTLPPVQVGATAAPPAVTALKLSVPTTVPRATNRTVSVTLRRADTQQTVADQGVTLTLRPTEGTVRVRHLTTNAAGTATVSLAFYANSTLSAASLASARLVASKASVTVHVMPMLTAALTAGSVKHGHSVVLYGSTSHFFAGEHVTRESWHNGAWHVNGKAHTIDANGHYSFSTKPGGKYTHYYRIVISASKKHVAGVSPTVTLKIH